MALKEIPPLLVRNKVRSLQLQVLDGDCSLQDILYDFILNLTGVVKRQILQFGDDGEYFLEIFGLQLCEVSAHVKRKKIQDVDILPQSYNEIVSKSGRRNRSSVREVKTRLLDRIWLSLSRRAGGKSPNSSISLILSATF